MKRSSAVVSGLILLASAQAFGADESRPAVAPPGRCAEPRTTAELVGQEGFSVVGPVSALFDPRDVAGGPTGADALVAQAPPSGRATTRPGACDQPGSGCGLASVSRVGVPPVEPGTRPPQTYEPPPSGNPLP